jgi:L-threonylcarbamoyladenylate synthase
MIDPADFDAAVAVLDSGRLLAIPTETVYGLAAKFDHHHAIDRLIALKNRDYRSDHIFTLMLADPAAINRYAIITDLAAPLIAQHFPGPLTLVLPKRPDFHNPYFDHYDTIGIRTPDHAYVLELLKRSGPLLVTSANLHGQPPALTDAAAAATLPGVSIVTGRAGGQLPSTVVDATADQLRVLRQGDIIISA